MVWVLQNKKYEKLKGSENVSNAVYSYNSELLEQKIHLLTCCFLLWIPV